MKKLLSLLSVLTISGSAVPTIIAASPYQNKKTNNLKKITRVKRQNNNDKLEPSIDTKNEIGKITEAGLLWRRNHKCYFIKLTPIFWREIINLYNNYYEEEFLKMLLKKIKKEFKDFFDMSYSEYRNNDGKRILRHHWSSDYLGKMIYKNLSNINNEWEKSNKTKRIWILFNFSSWESPPDNTRWMETKYIERTFEWYHNYISANIEDNYDEYENRYDWNNYNDNYKINNLRSNFKDFNKYLIDLGIIDDNENKTILDSLQKQNRNLDISQLEIIKK